MASAAPSPPAAGGATIIDGTATAKEIRAELAVEVGRLQAEHGVTPGLAVVLVGERPDSATYVRMKKKAAAECCFHSVDIGLPIDVTQEALLAAVDGLNADPKVHGILVQLPLPPHIDEALVLRRIAVEKDADGFSALNIGNMCLRGGEAPLALPCTPAGCIELIKVGVAAAPVAGFPCSGWRLTAPASPCHSAQAST